MRPFLLFLVLAASSFFFAACNADPASMSDAGTDMGEPDAFDPHNGLRLPECESLEPTDEDALPLVPSTLISTVVPMSPRQVMDGELNPTTEDGELLYSSMGYNLYVEGPALERVRRDDLGDVEAPMGERHSLAWFVQYSDFQLADDESPLRVTITDNPSIPGGMRAQEAYLPHAISAFNRTFARIENPDHPYDFGIITGDCADSAQRNEIRWVIEVMNGHAGMHVDSAEDNDPIPGPDNDPKDPFDPTPFPAPWLFVVGNHDVEVVGFAEVTDSRRAQAIGTIPTTGTRDYRQWYAPVTLRQVPADPEREIMDREDIVEVLRADTEGAGPPGHGFSTTEDPDFELGANYEYDAIPGLLRVISLDTSDVTGGSYGLVRRATIDEFLVPALERATSDGVLVIMASHHATSDIDTRREQLGPIVADAVPPADIEEIVASYPAVIAWITGHAHTNRIRAKAGADAAHPGYWEIMASAIADFPSQQRTIEIVDNGNGTLSLFSTVIDYDTESCNERRFRRLTQIEYLSGWSDPVSLEADDHNVELIIPIPESASANVTAASAGATTRIESETTLRGL